MAYSSIFAGTGAFWSVAILSMYLLRLLERLNTSIYDSTVVLAIICFLCLYFAYISAGEAVGWITELRIKQKDMDTAEGMDRHEVEDNQEMMFEGREQECSFLYFRSVVLSEDYPFVWGNLFRKLIQCD